METRNHREAWNKGKLVGQKAPLKPKDIWAIRIHLQNAHEVRDLAMFNLAIDSKLRGCDLVSLRVRDVTHGNQVLSRAMVVQRKTQRPVQFELTELTRTAVVAWIAKAGLRSEDFLFPCRLHDSPHVSTRRYARIVEHWVVAERQGQTAARNMLGESEPFDAVPFFWSQHYDVPINYVGHAEKWDEIVIDGDIKAKDCLLQYKRNGRVLAVDEASRVKAKANELR